MDEFECPCRSPFCKEALPRAQQDGINEQHEFIRKAMFEHN